MLTVAMGEALGVAVSPVSHKPHMVIVFSSFAVAMVLTTLSFGYYLLWEQERWWFLLDPH